MTPPGAVLAFLGEQVSVAPETWFDYDLWGRSGQRRREIADGLVDLLIQIVHRIGVRAEQRVAAELVGEIHKVEDKTGLLFRIAEAGFRTPTGPCARPLPPGRRGDTQPPGPGE